MLISEALKAAGCEGKVKIAMDCAASEFHGGQGRGRGRLQPGAAPACLQPRLRRRLPCRAVAQLAAQPLATWQPHLPSTPNLLTVCPLPPPLPCHPASPLCRRGWQV